MNVFAQIANYMDEIIDEFKAEARRTQRVAVEDGWLGARELSILAESNARSAAAVQVKDTINQTLAFTKKDGMTEEEVQKAALPHITRAIESKLRTTLSSNDNHISTARVFNEVLTVLNNER